MRACPDSQTVKASHAPGGSGYDAARRTKRRKRHVTVHTDVRLLMFNLTTTDIQDAAGTEQIVVAVRKRWLWLKHLFADGTCDRGGLMSAAAYCGSGIQVVRKLPDHFGVQTLPRRWLVERTFGWMTRWRQLVHD